MQAEYKRQVDMLNQQLLGVQQNPFGKPEDAQKQLTSIKDRIWRAESEFYGAVK